MKVGGNGYNNRVNQSESRLFFTANKICEKCVVNSNFDFGVSSSALSMSYEINFSNLLSKHTHFYFLLIFYVFFGFWLFALLLIKKIQGRSLPACGGGKLALTCLPVLKNHIESVPENGGKFKMTNTQLDTNMKN